MSDEQLSQSKNRIVLVSYKETKTGRPIRVAIVQGDLLQQPGIIVRASGNPGFSFAGGYVERALLEANPNVFQEAQEAARRTKFATTSGLTAGNAVITEGKGIRPKLIVHVVTKNHEETSTTSIAAATVGAIDAAETVPEANMVSFPLMGSGVANMGFAESARAMLQGIDTYYGEHPNSHISDVQIVMYDRGVDLPGIFRSRAFDFHPPEQSH
jgi:O-acetyl-ADP-ribose deacetylase (regulator of RNase III)